jgi:hypothetical protein
VDLVSACRAVLWLLLLAGASAACRDIAGLQPLAYKPTCSNPTLPATGSGRIRLVDAGTQGGDVDFCIRPSGTQDWGQSVFADGGPSCQPGLEYAQATIPFAAPAGNIDVEAIPAGASCTDPATSQAKSVAVGDASQGAPVVTILRSGGGAIPESTVGLPEDGSPPSPSSITVRLVNALAGGGAINVGYTSASALPATIAPPAPALPVPIQPGGVEPMQGNTPLGPVDGAGYITVSTFANLGIVLGSSLDAIVVLPSGGQQAVLETLFVIGDPSDATHAMRGLVCLDEAGPGTDPLLAQCNLTALPSLAIDTVNTSLYGADVRFEDQRRGPVFDAIQGRTTTDAMCVLEVYRTSDKQTLLSKAAGRFPYSFYAKTDMSTPPDDPSDANGQVPPAPTVAPCSAVDGSVLDAAFQCVAQKCTPDQSMSETISTTACLPACTAQFASFYRYSLQDSSCFDCIIYHLSSEEPLDSIQTTCTQDPGPHFAFGGMAGEVILSHYPLINPQAYVLPATGYRRVVLYAGLQLEDQTVDFFCAHTSSSLNDAVLPYSGSYGMDGTKAGPDGGVVEENGWEDEQLLQVQKIIRFIQAKHASTKRPGIVAGDWHSSVRYPSDPGATPVLLDVAPEILEAVDQAYGGAFLRAEPSGYVPVCEYCPSPQNPYNPPSGTSAVPSDLTRSFLVGFSPGATVEDSIWGTANDITVTAEPSQPAPPGGTFSRFEFYPRLVRVVRPPVP